MDDFIRPTNVSPSNNFNEEPQPPAPDSVQPPTDPFDKKSKPKTKKLLVTSLLIIILIGGGLFAAWWFMLREQPKTEQPNTNNAEKTTYLTNDNQAVCIQKETKLSCENLQTAELQEITLPKAYRTATDIEAHPDGTKLLVTMGNGDIVVTDADFKEIRKLFKGSEVKDRSLAFAWTDNSDQVIVSEVTREKSDTQENPAPIVVSIVDIQTGESERVYKTGEQVNAEDVKVLGGNSEYIFVAYPTPKNWIADSTSAPQDSLDAIRLSDGAVRPVSTYQIDENKAGTGSYYYDSANKVFLFDREQGDGDAQLVGGTLEDGENGLTLKKAFGINQSVGLDLQPVLSVKGLIYEDFSAETDDGKFVAIQDDGTKTELKVVSDNKYGRVYSVKTVPAPAAESE